MAAAKTHPKSSIANGMKRCTRCSVSKPVAAFTELAAHPGSFTSRCRPCNAQQAARKRREYPAKSSTSYRKWMLKSVYGITPEKFDEMLTSQSGGCAICGATQAGGRGRFHVDHDHKTGKVRGLLCHPCNTGLGSFKDDAARLRLAAQYLTREGN